MADDKEQSYVDSFKIVRQTNGRMETAEEATEEAAEEVAWEVAE